MITNTKGQGKGVDEFTKNTSEEDMDRLLEARNDEILAMLEVGQAAIDRGEVVFLPPLHEFLREARDAFEASE